jgi:hypothetical protein
LQKSVLIDGVQYEVNETECYRRNNLWAVRIGYWWGRGYSAREVAELVGENTTPGTVRGQVRKAKVLPATPLEPIVPVQLPFWQRDKIAAKAKALGLSPDELISRVLECALVYDDLYDAVTDGRYDPKPERKKAA